MKKLNIIIQIVAVAGSLTMSCTELPHTQTPIDNVPPAALSNVQVESLPGGAKFTYEVPNEKDISYVKAEYTYKGEKKTVRASIYNNSLIIEGFGSVEPVDVTLYVVDHSDNISEGIAKTFTPDTPPIETVFQSVKILPSFGGIVVTWLNELATEIGITVFSEDEKGIMREGDTRYSKETKGEITFRGFDSSEEKHFAVRITDKWGNVSEIKDGRVTPLVERELDKKLWSAMEFPGDNTSANAGRVFSNCWDGSKTVIWNTGGGAFVPTYLTIDCGVEIRFSRMVFFARIEFEYYTSTWKQIELWGAKDYKRDQPVEYWTGNEWKTDGTWEHLGDFEFLRPSGETVPVRPATGIDLEYAQKGFEFNVPLEKEPLRYVRIVVTEVIGNSSTQEMAEFYFYGAAN
jgi:hypothetical protein